jgi:ABC-type lipoprotein export system ATPase subunit
MHILAGFDTPTSGWVEIDGTRLDGLDDRHLTLHRRREVGFIFQSYNLLPVLNAEQNILLVTPWATSAWGSSPRRRSSRSSWSWPCWWA